MARIASLPIMLLVGVLAVAGGPARSADGEAETLAWLEARVEALEGAFRESVVLTAGPCSGYCVTSCSTGRFSASRIVTMRAPWITLPAPTPITRSARAERAASVARITEDREVSLSISSNTPASRSPSSSRMRETSGVRRDTVRPHTMKARRAPFRATSAGSFSRASVPL